MHFGRGESFAFFAENHMNLETTTVLGFLAGNHHIFWTPENFRDFSYKTLFVWANNEFLDAVFFYEERGRQRVQKHIIWEGRGYKGVIKNA